MEEVNTFKPPRFLTSHGSYELKRLLETIATKRSNEEAERAKTLIHERLEYYLGEVFKIIQRGKESKDKERLAFLTYYSHLIERNKKKPGVDELLSSDDEFIRISVTPLGKLDADSHDSFWQSSNNHIKYLEEEKTKLRALCSKSPLREYWNAVEESRIKEINRFKWEKLDTDENDEKVKDMIRIHLKFVEDTPCLPVNVSVALCVNIALTEDLYSKIIDKTLFEHHQSLGPGEKLEWLEQARNDENVCRTSLFSKTSRENLKSLIEMIARDIEKRTAGEDIFKGIETFLNGGESGKFFNPRYLDILNNVKLIFNRPGKLDTSGTIEWEQLHKLAVRLFLGEIGINHSHLVEDLCSGKEISLKDLQKFIKELGDKDFKDKNGIHDDAWESYQFSRCPSLPFFLAAALFDGTYKDLINFIYPPVAWGINELRVITVDRCTALRDILFELSVHWDDILLKEQLKASVNEVKEDRSKMSSCIAYLISKNPFGNLVVLKKTEKKNSTPTGPEFNSIFRNPKLKQLIQNIFIPIREMELYATLLRQKNEESKILYGAYRNIVHDMGNELNSLDPLFSLLRPMKPDDEKELPLELKLSHFFRDDAPKTFNCFLDSNSTGKVNKFWRDLQNGVVLRISDSHRKIPHKVYKYYSILKQEMKLTTEFSSIKDPCSYLSDIRGDKLLDALKAACEMISGDIIFMGGTFKRNIKPGVVYEKQNLHFWTMFIKMAFHNAAKFSNKDFKRISGEITGHENGAIHFKLENHVDTGLFHRKQGTKSRRRFLNELGNRLYGSRRFKMNFPSDFDILKNKKYTIELIVNCP